MVYNFTEYAFIRTKSTLTPYNKIKNIYYNHNSKHIEIGIILLIRCFVITLCSKVAKYVLWFIIFFVITVLLLIMQLIYTDAKAGSDTEIINEYKVFDPALECSAHTDFLKGKDVTTPNNCHGIATYQIENRQLTDIQFLKKMSLLADDGTSLGALIKAMQSSIFGDPTTIYSATELASRRVMISLGQSGDVERAVFYGQLLSDIKHKSLSYFCRKNTDCVNMGISLKTGKAFGASLSYIDDFPPQATLMCLLRVDSYLSPLRTILHSHKFSSCLKARKHFEGADQ